MARPRLELLARHAALLFVEAVVAAVSAAIEYAAEDSGIHNHMTEPLLLGAQLGAGEEASLEKIVESINRVFRKIPKVKARIALETTAGQGSCLGHRFEQISCVINNVCEPERLCVCLDTAHIFAAGYDIGSAAGIKRTFREFDRTIGLSRLAAIHLNDSKTARGSRVDRHQHIGKGQIGLDAFRFIM